MKVKVLDQSRLTLCDPMNCSLPGCTLHGILQARILEWMLTPFSREFSEPKDQTKVCIDRQILYCLSHQRRPRMLLNAAQGVPAQTSHIAIFRMRSWNQYFNQLPWQLWCTSGFTDP